MTTCDILVFSYTCFLYRFYALFMVCNTESFIDLYCFVATTNQASNSSSQ